MARFVTSPDVPPNISSLDDVSDEEFDQEDERNDSQGPKKQLRRSLNTSSYQDRYFTMPEVMAQHCESLACAIDGDPASLNRPVFFFDFSAGDGRLCLVASECFQRHHRTFQYCGVDIQPTALDATSSVVVHTADWLREGPLAPLSSFSSQAKECNAIVVLGYNPPFGRGGSLSEKFLRSPHLKTLRPKWLLLVVPIRQWHPPDYGPVARGYVAKESFFLPDIGERFDVSCEWLVLKRGEATMMKCEHMRVKANDTGKLSKWWRGESDGCKVWLLLRKVGHYAGRQMYYLGPSSHQHHVHVMYWPGGDGQSREAKDYGDIRCGGDDDDGKNDDVLSNAPPWQNNGHIVCSWDEPTSYRGSNPAAATKNKGRRQGTGFLKIHSQVGTVETPQLQYEEFCQLAQQLEKFIVDNNLNTGAPKSISAAIAERFFVEASIAGTLPWLKSSSSSSRVEVDDKKKSNTTTSVAAPKGSQKTLLEMFSKSANKKPN